MADNSWRDSKEEEQVFSGGDILRLSVKDGQKVTLRVLGRYVFFRQHWFEKIKRGSICNGVNCPVCASGDRGSLRYVVNVLDKADGKIKLFEFGRRVKTSIENIAEDYGNPEGYDLIIRRTGSGAEDTVYTITPARDSVPLTEAEKALVKYDLTKLYAPTPLEKVNSFMQGVIPQRQDNNFTPKKEQPSQPQGNDLPTLSD